ncbi:MAG: ATP-binding cassette domain-containing protein [Bacteroidales bacterium]|nr:ATP-binding cassette domain-containing protein [Bacteroidales bacterium]
MNLIEVQNVTKRYTNHLALDDVSLSIPQGRIFGLLGPNGAGKTTLIRILNQIIMPDSGTVLFNNRPLAPKDVENIGYLPEERGLYKKMRVGEQALYLARLKGVSKNDALARLRNWFEKFGIDNWWNRNVEELSKGMQQKIQFIVTLIHQPELYIFDEPFSGFDPVNSRMLKEEILELKKQGATIVLSTHNMTSVEEICDDIVLINKSKVILSGAVRDVRQQFKKHLYNLEMAHLDPRYRDTLPEEVQVRFVSQEDDRTTMTIKMPETKNANDLLAFFMQFSEIQSFNEILPSMDEIFIENVR